MTMTAMTGLLMETRCEPHGGSAAGRCGRRCDGRCDQRNWGSCCGLPCRVVGDGAHRAGQHARAFGQTLLNFDPITAIGRNGCRPGADSL